MKKYIFISLIIIQGILGFGQTVDPDKYLPNITPPSPVAYELGKYGNIPVGLVTGAPNVNIPLYSYKTKNIEIPISLFYAKSGIKVDDVAGNVGLGWNCNMGGVINRTIRDRQDMGNTIFPNDDALAPGLSPEKYLFYKSLEPETADSEPDLYSFNFNGNSGQFVFYKGNLTMLKESKIKIDYTNTNNLSGFIATTLDGVQYYFSAPESTLRSTRGAGHSEPSSSITAWYLTKIVQPNAEEIYFTYQDIVYDYITSKSQILSFTPSGSSANYGCPNIPITAFALPRLSNIYEDYSAVLAQKLTQISSNNTKYGSILFDYIENDLSVPGLQKISSITVKGESNNIIEKIDFSYFATANNRVFLDKITYLDPTKKYAFEYIDKEGLPERLSFKQDKWGYYNGKTNTAIIPSGIQGYGLENINYGGANKEIDPAFTDKGMLNKIVYPTKGYTQLEYESNSYFGTKTINPPITTRRIQAILPNGNESQEVIITVPTFQYIKITGKSVFNSGVCATNLDVSRHYGDLQVFDTTTNLPINLYNFNSYGQPNDLGTSQLLTGNLISFFIKAEANKSYKFIVTATRTCTNAFCDIAYMATAPTIVQDNILTGGLRTKKVFDYGSDGSLKTYKKYYYTLSTTNLTSSSARPVKIDPSYTEIQTRRTMCYDGSQAEPGTQSNLSTGDYQVGTVTSSSLMSLFDNEGNNVYYPKVIESIGGDNFENGAIEHNFKITRNNQGNPLIGDDIKYCPTVNSAWDNGNEELITTYVKKNANLIRVNEKKYNYKLNPNVGPINQVFSCRKNFEILMIWSNYNLDNLANLSIKSYEIRNNWSYLDNMIETNYDINGQNPIETKINYTYGNRNHLQLTNQTMITSNNQSIETKYFYPQDLANAPLINDLIAKNIIAIPMKTETWANNQKKSEKQIIYAKDATTNNLLLPKNVYSANFPNTLPILSNNIGQLENKITYNQYDDKGNIQQYTPESGISVSIIWGYNKTKPIAKIENATYADIQTYEANLQTLSNTGTEANLIIALNTLRANLPNAMVTTYTHKPLVGVSTFTDPKGNQIIYTYDSFGRLENVKDKDNNTLSANEYHYKN